MISTSRSPQALRTDLGLLSYMRSTLRLRALRNPLFEFEIGIRMQPPDFEEPFDSDSSSKKLWTEVPEAIRKDVEEHVLAHLPADMLAKLHDLHAQGIPISSDNAFFHFGGGMAVRNLCRERLSDNELAAFVPFGGDWDNCYVGVLAAIAARRQ